MLVWKKNLCSVWFSQIFILTGFGFFMPFIPYYIREFGISNKDDVNFWIGLLSAGPALSLGIMAPVWGILSDKFGRKMMILRSSGAAAVLLFCMAQAQTIELLFFLRVFQGVFSGTVGASTTLVASTTPSNKLSESLGFLASSTFIGMSIGPFIGGITADYYGYRISIMIGSLITLLGFFSVLFFTKEGTQELAVKDSSEIQKNKNTSFRIPQIILICFFLLFMSRFSRMLIKPFIPLHLETLRGSSVGIASFAGGVEGIAGLITALSGVFITRLERHFNNKKILFVILLCAFIFALPLAMSSTMFCFILCYLLVVLSLGGVDPLIQAALGKNSSKERYGLLFGIQTAVSSFGWFLSPLIGSFLVIKTGMTGLFISFAACMLVTAFLVLFMKNVRRKDF